MAQTSRAQNRDTNDEDVCLLLQAIAAKHNSTMKDEIQSPVGKIESHKLGLPLQVFRTKFYDLIIIQVRITCIPILCANGYTIVQFEIVGMYLRQLKSTLACSMKQM